MIVTEGPEHDHRTTHDVVESLRKGLPGTAPYRLWRNHELTDDEGRTYAVDLLVLTLNGLWLVQTLPNTGTLTGGDAVWRWSDTRQGRTRTVESPWLALRRVRDVLDARVQAVSPQPLSVRAGLLLTGSVRLDGPIPAHTYAPVAGHADLLPSLTDELMAPPDQPERVVRSTTSEALATALARVGLRPANARIVAGYRLGALLEDHETWQERRATHAQTGAPARVRTWVVPKGRTAEERATLSRAARTEGSVLARLGEHPHILGLLDTDERDNRPSLVFEHVDGLPLDKFLRAEPRLPFTDRVQILLNVGDALAHCHRQEVLHRNLSPASILVARSPSGAIDVRLHRFAAALAGGDGHTRLGTRHVSHLSGDVDALYRASELFAAPDAADASADLFSLGAVAWFLFTGRHPAPDLARRGKQIREDEGLRLWRVSDEHDDALDDLIGAATRQWPHERLFDGAALTVPVFLAVLRKLYAEAPADVPVVDPLTAVVGDVLDSSMGPLAVEGVLGTGATSRVLQVKREGVTYALKLPLQPRHAASLSAEAHALRQLAMDDGSAHPSIVGLHGEPVIGDTTGLLLQFAGTTTLADLVRAEGSLSLDYCARIGDQLLAAVSHLHARGVPHRDLKPANLAFASTSKQANRLRLFDFSLAAIDPGQIGAGTQGWRDPFLPERGAWDDQADLYGAAACLHYALTGERPSMALRGEHAGTVPVRASRFDPGVRGALQTFFTRAFASDPEQRHADADAMHDAWRTLFDEDTTSVGGDADRAALVAKARLDTAVGMLGLSSRAVDGLERAGVFDVRDLLALPTNRLSAVRGVGQETAAQIHEVAQALRQRLGGRDDTAVEPFVGPLAGLPVSLFDVDLPLPDDAETILHDAGLRTTHELALLGKQAVVRLLGLDARATRALQKALRAAAADTAVTGDLATWVKALMRPNTPSKRTAWETRVGTLFGLEPLDDDRAPLGGRTVPDVATHFALTQPELHAELDKARRNWSRKADALDAATAAVRRAFVAPAARLEDVAEALVRTHAPASAVNDADARAHAAALVRVVCERGTDSPLVWRTIAGLPWVAPEVATLAALATAAANLDTLARAPQPATADTALLVLVPHVRGTVLADLEPTALLQLAASASTDAARSARGEIYRRDLPADDAVRLAAGVLQGELTADEIRRRVHARYPEAADVPERPELDALVRPLGLLWSDDRGRYLRPGTQAGGLSQTRGTRFTTRDTNSPDAVAAQRFTRDLQRALEAGGFRALQVSAKRSEQAAQHLQRHFPVLQRTSVDRAVFEALQARIAGSRGAKADAIYAIERAGPTHPRWRGLLEHMVFPVFDALVTATLEAAASRPQLLVHPGLFARYGAEAHLYRLIEGATEGDLPVWLVVPAYNDGAHPTLLHPAGDLPLPTTRPAQQLRIPRRWLDSEALS